MMQSQIKQLITYSRPLAKRLPPLASDDGR